MPVPNKYEQYDSMSTEALEELLRQDFLLQDDDDSDTDAIFYIAELLADRKEAASPGCFGDIDESWNDFRRKFILCVDPDEENTPLPPAAHNAAKSKLPRRTFRTVVIAAALAAVLAVAAYAAGFWGWLPTWDEDIFSFSADAEGGAGSLPPCESLEEALARHNAPANIVPAYFPAGYEQIEFTYASFSENFTKFSCTYSNENNIITLQYTIELPNNSSSFTKDGVAPEVCTVNGVEHYIMTNVDSYAAIWRNGNFECSLSGFPSREELIKSINSMY